MPHLESVIISHIELQDSGIKDITKLQTFCQYKKAFPDEPFSGLIVLDETFIKYCQIYENEENLTLVKKQIRCTQLSNIFDNFDLWFE